MLKYSLKRLLMSIPLLLAMTMITFIFIQLAPGDFLANLKLNPQISREAIAVYEKQFHLDQPLIMQYLIWLKNLLKLDLGYSFAYQAPVKDVIASRVFNTLLLSASALLFSWFIAIPLGIIAASKKNRLTGKLITGFSYLGISTPSFFLAILLLYAAFATRLLPLGGRSVVNYEELSFFR